MSENQTAVKDVTMKDLKATDPRWCTGCGDYTILVGLRKFMVNRQIRPEDTVNVSGIGCSGRIPHYMNTYGLHSIHGRAIPVSLGIALANPNLKVFIHSGDGDSLSIGGNHLIHGIKKNFNCVYLLFDNQIYGLTKNQTSPTTQRGLATQTQPSGSYLDPINPIRFALGLGATFVARSSSPIIQHSAGTIIGSISLYCPVATLTSVVGLTIFGSSVASPFVIASVTIFALAWIFVKASVSAVYALFLYCATIAVELSPAVD